MDDGLAEGGPQRSSEVQRSPTARVETCISCLHPQLLGHLETPADPEFHPRSSLRPRVPLMTRWVCKAGPGAMGPM